MWNIKQDEVIFNKLALIAGEQNDLLYYDFPILFTGLNLIGERIIGSFIDIDEEKDTENYLHAIITDNDWSLYKDRIICYPEVLRRAKNVFVVSCFEQNPITYSLTFNDIPEEYRPKETALFPQ